MTLTPAEAVAGISRKALETFQRQNGRPQQPQPRVVRTTHIKAEAPLHSAPTVNRTETFVEMSTTKVTSIVSSPMRLIDLLEHLDGMFVLRETAYSGNGVHAQSIWFKRHELVKLGDAIGRMEKA